MTDLVHGLWSYLCSVGLGRHLRTKIDEHCPRTTVLSTVHWSWPSFGFENGLVDKDDGPGLQIIVLPMVRHVPSSFGIENGRVEQDR